MNYVVNIEGDAPGPFNIYYDTASAGTLVYSSASRTELINGLIVGGVPVTASIIWIQSLDPDCDEILPYYLPTPTPTPQPTATPAPTPTPVVEDCTLSGSFVYTFTPTPAPTATPVPSATPTPTPAPTATPAPTPTPTPTLEPSSLAIYAKYINSTGSLQYSINGGSPILLGPIETSSCLVTITISSLSIGDTVTFSEVDTKAVAGSESTCPNGPSGFLCSYTRTITTAGLQYVYLTVDGDSFC